LLICIVGDAESLNHFSTWGGWWSETSLWWDMNGFSSLRGQRI
jgi:hypothetical protein